MGRKLVLPALEDRGRSQLTSLETAWSMPVVCGADLGLPRMVLNVDCEFLPDPLEWRTNAPQHYSLLPLRSGLVLWAASA